MTHRGVIRVSTRLLAEYMSMPNDTEIVHIIQNYKDKMEDFVTIIVSHPQLPEKSEGSTPSCIRLDYGEDGKSKFSVI